LKSPCYIRGLFVLHFTAALISTIHFFYLVLQP
jgi:hypothetical protein